MSTRYDLRYRFRSKVVVVGEEKERPSKFYVLLTFIYSYSTPVGRTLYSRVPNDRDRSARSLVE
jgi:hypothetical protein